eukprot:EG_transcript_29531
MLSNTAAFSLASTGFYTAFIFSYLILGDVDSARFLYKRLAASVKEDNDIQGAWSVAKCMWNQKLPEAHVVLNIHSWRSESKVYVEALRAAMRVDALDLFSRAYSNLALTELAPNLGCTAEEAVAMAQSRGLVKEVQGGFVVWKSVKPDTRAVPVTAVTGLDTLKRLAQHSLFIER